MPELTDEQIEHYFLTIGQLEAEILNRIDEFSFEVNAVDGYNYFGMAFSKNYREAYLLGNEKTKFNIPFYLDLPDFSFYHNFLQFLTIEGYTVKIPYNIFYLSLEDARKKCIEYAAENFKLTQEKRKELEKYESDRYKLYLELKREFENE